MTEESKREFMLNFWAVFGVGLAMLLTLGPLLVISILVARCAK